MQKIRKAVQIAALRFETPGEVAGSPGGTETEIVALCDDGTIWSMLGTGNEWVPLPPIPQDQLRDDWLAEVADHLVTHHFVRKDAVTGVLADYNDELRAAFNRHESAQQSAKAINAKFQQSA